MAEMCMSLAACILFLMYSMVNGAPFCQPYPTSDPGSKSPPLPWLADSYHIHVEANLIDQGFTASSEEFYDSENNKAAVIMYINGGSNNLIFSYDTNELFRITDGKVCTVSKLSDDKDRFLFGDTTANGKSQIYNAAGAFKFGKQYGQKYMGPKSVRGIECDHWQSCISWTDRNSVFTVDYYFTALNWSTVPDVSQVPVRADVQGVTIDKNNVARNFHHVYDFYHFRPNHDFRHDDAHDYETPSGVVCPGRNKTALVPKLSGQYYYREDIVLPEGGTVIGYDIWFDSSYHIIRKDYRDDTPKAPFWSNNPMTEIHDFNTGVAYVIDKELGNCTIMPIEDTAFDTVKIKEDSGQGANAPARFALRGKTAQEMFYLDSSYQYAGSRVVDGKLCDVFVSNRTDFPIPGAQGLTAILEFYFLDQSWTETTTNSAYQTTTYPVKLVVSVNDIGYQAFYNFYNFNEQHPDLSNFDISPCFDQDSSMDIQIHFPGQYFPLVNDNKKFIELEARLGIAQYSSISPLRIQNTQIHYDSWSFYFDATLLDRPPTSAKFHKYAGQVQMSSNDKTINNVNSADSCAYSCLTETSFQCKSFDICPRKGLCTLSRSTADDGALVANTYCNHYSRNILNGTIIETPVSQAFDVLKDMIYKNMFTIQILLPAGKQKKYRAISIRNNIVRDPTGTPTLSSSAKLKEFTSVRNKALSGNNDDVLPGVTVDDCATACVDEDIFFCQSFEYCYNTGDCRLSKRHPAEVPSMVVDSDSCDLYSRNYTYKFTKSAGTVVMEQTPELYQAIMDVNTCAKLCIDLTKFNCKSFQFCDGISVCALSTTHLLDVPQANIQEEPYCDHYTRNYLDDFKFVRGKQLALTNNQIIEGASLDECAKLCAEQGVTCLGFDFCGNDTYCRLTSNSVKNIGQLTVESSAYCNHYSRQYYSDGSLVTSYSVNHQKNDSLQYGNGSMAALGIIMILLGGCLTIACYILYMKLARGQTIDDMKMNFVNMDSLSNE